MSISSLRIVVSGLIAQYPLGGVTWDYVQYVAGLKRLGHDVYYIEDTGLWPYNPNEEGVSKGCDFNVAYLRDVMSRFGLEDRWAYRFPWESQWFGMSEMRRSEVVANADLVVNVSGTLEHPAEYGGRARLVYVDSDPVFTQVKLARGQEDFQRLVGQHDVHFSFGEHLTELVPDTGYHWLPTRQPVLLEEWRSDTTPRSVLTTVMNWTSYKAVEFEGKSYGQKDQEFMRFIGLPRALKTPIEVAMSVGKTRRAPLELLRHRGWDIVDPQERCPDLDSYRTYLDESLAEWSVAKNGYVVGRPGWFSCRSACYLAAGRPTIVQDTGFRDVLPVGRGIIPFTGFDEAVDGINEVVANYERHSAAARAIAAAYFDSDLVLARLVEDAMSAPAALAAEATR